MDICVVILLNFSRTLYPSGLGFCLGGALDDDDEGPMRVDLPPHVVIHTPHWVFLWK